MNSRRLVRSAIAVVVIFSLLASSTPVLAESHNFVYGAEDFSNKTPTQVQPKERNSSQKFIDKWIVNGGALGSAIGSIIGCFVFQTFFPGPVGLILGTLVGGTIGSLIGTYIDDRNGEAINYTSFKRPPVTKGGIWLKGVGPWEQFMYQVDAFALNGGSIGANLSHITLSLLAKSVPGIGAWLSPIVIGLSDYVCGVIGDNIDGEIDLGDIGKKWDSREPNGSLPSSSSPEPKGSDAHNFAYNDADFKVGQHSSIVELPCYKRQAPTLPSTGQSGRVTYEPDNIKENYGNYRQSYQNVLNQMQSGSQSAQREAFLAYRQSYSRMR